jgi:hypothetical protein
MAQQKFSPGDPVIYRRSKCTPHPGPRAVHVTPAPRGEDYAYEVDKFWVVVEMRSNRTLVLRTRRGKLTGALGRSCPKTQDGYFRSNRTNFGPSRSDP